MEDVGASRWASFGLKEGVYRLLATLERNKIRATFLVNAIVAEREPALLRQMVDAGHDVASHGYSQDQFLMGMSRKEQHDIIKRCVSLLKDTTGRRPTGWVTSVYSWTDETHELLAEEGFTWHADALDSSFPYIEHFGSRSIVALPWCDFVDNRVLRASPSDYVSAYDGMIRQARTHEPLGLVHVGMHCHFGGRPLMAAAIDEVLTRLKFPDIWLATHNDVAAWFEAQKIDRIDCAALFARA
jgi:peptidoglycan/xylan/chitin deacetylase (PgdA/CDA1 family)